VITPLVSIITNVSMDNEQYLGDTLALVAGEKAGIIKKQIPLVSAVADDDSGKIILQTCMTQEAPLFLLNRDFKGVTTGKINRWQYQGLEEGQILSDLPMSMKGHYQIDNASLALATIQLLSQQGWTISEEQLRTGLAQTRWPGRLEYFRHKQEGQGDSAEGLRFLLDGAHNPAGVAALQQALSDFSFRQLILVWGAMADKDLGTTLQAIAPIANTIIFTRPESERSATSKELQAALPPASAQKIIATDSVQTALDQACALAGEDDLICIAGSLYLVGAARQLLLGDLVNGE
ncbi:MAG: bifunctional folylpolyglutamate synthase/dihydrofolate synthase, partial [Candidatus Electrothrix sp. AR3]|nr:bifunctional folylpolyglutamate synthase/dihydrofolate synthase [Candidatus Electrothrix sp. AR3]